MSDPIAYAGRKSDIGVFLGAELGGPVLLEENLFSAEHPRGVLVTGVQKLAQRFLLHLLKPLGTDLSRPDDGTYFLARVFSSNYRTAQRVAQVFAEAVVQVTPVILAEESDQMPADERFASATLTGVSFPGDGSLQLAILLRSQAGEDFTFIQPLAI